MTTMADTELTSLGEQVERLTRQVQWLLDKEGIRNTKQLYCRLVDSGRYDEWQDLFTEDYYCQPYAPRMADGSPPRVTKFPTKQAWIDFARTSGAARARIDATAGRESGVPPGTATPGPAGGQRLPG